MTVHEALEAKIAEYPTAREACRFFRVSEPYLSQVRTGARVMPERIAALLGYRLEWRKVDDQP